MSAVPDAGQQTPGLLRWTAQITGGNLVSRLTGLARVVAVGAVLGTTFLGNTYQTSNLLSNILFELLAAGLLSAVLVPPLVALLDQGSPDQAEEVAGALLGVCLAVLGAVTVAGLVARPWLMRALTVAVTDPEVRRQQVRLGSFLLWFFLPQVLLYAVGAVATALLHSARRFTAPAFAPVANNLVVVATMVMFWALRHGHGARSGLADLALPGSERLVLAVGTTAGVALMTLVPLVALHRAGLRLRPRWQPSSPRVRALCRAGGWAAGALALNQLLVAATLVLANRVEGGVVAYTIAFTFFLLPHALVAHPLSTALFPRMASEGQSGRRRELAATLAGGTRMVVFLAAPASALLVALAHPALRVVQGGSLGAAGGGLVARVLAAYGLGLVGYAGLHLLTRASYAVGDARTPTFVNLGVAAGGSALMALLFGLASGGDRVVVLGVAHSVAMVGGAGVLLVALRRRLGDRSPLARWLSRSLLCAAVAGVAARVVADALGLPGRVGAAVTVVAAALVALATYGGIQWCLGAPELRAAVLSPRVAPVPASSDAGTAP